MISEMMIDWAFETSLAVAFLVLFVLIVRKPVAYRFGAHMAYALWVLPLIRIFLPNITLAILPTPPQMSSQPVIRDTLIPPDRILPVQDTVPLVEVPGLILSLWLSVAIVWLLVALLRHHHFVQSQRYSSRRFSDGDLFERVNRISRLKSCPEIRISNSQTGPLVTGLLNPLIILPSNFETGFTREQQYFALLHEMTHIKRFDLWAALVALVFRALNWPNPLIHIAAKYFRADQEAACDASVLKAASEQNCKHIYAETLLHAAKTVARKNISAPIGLTIYHPLKERLTMMTHHKKPSLISKFAMGTAVLGALALATPVNFAAADDTELAGQAEMKQTSKKVIKSIEIVNGQEVKTHYEIMEDETGKRAFKIDDNGDRTEIDPATIETKHKMHVIHGDHGDADMNVTIVKGADGEKIQKKIKIISTDGQMSQADIDKLITEHGDGEQVFIKKNEGTEGPGQHHVQVYKFSSENDFEIELEGDEYTYNSGVHSKAMVSAASGLLDSLNDDDLSEKTKRKIEKARKALKEAEKALEQEK